MNHVGERKEKLVDRGLVLRCSVTLPKLTYLENADDQDKTTIKLTTGLITEWINKLDLLR